MTSAIRRIVGARVSFATGAALALSVALPVLASAPPSGYTGKGTIVVHGPLPNTTLPIDLQGDVAFETRGDLLRLDILAVSLPGAGVVGSALATQLFPAGGVSGVYDRGTSTYTVWSNANRKYYTASTNGKTNSAATPVPEASAAGTRNPFGFEKSLRDLAALNLSVSLIGHSPVNGHPATGLNFLFTPTTASGNATDLHGTVWFADDVDGLPVQLMANFKNKYVPQVSLRADVTQLAKASPADADFRPPPGFTRTDNLGDVLGKTLHP